MSKLLSSFVRYIKFEDGGVFLRSIVLLLTLIIISGSILAVLNAQGENQQVFHRKAVAISEYGLLAALQHLKDHPDWVGSIDKTEYDEGWYAVSATRSTQNGVAYLTICSEGHMNSQTDVKECVLRLDSSSSEKTWVRESIR